MKCEVVVYSHPWMPPARCPHPAKFERDVQGVKAQVCGVHNRTKRLSKVSLITKEKT